MKTTHTHRGTCQACGHVQAVDNTTSLVAKHGYKVTFGYFHGVCPGGRGYKPAEYALALTHKTIAECIEAAKDNDKSAAALRNGTVIPATFERYNPLKIVYKRNVWGRQYESKGGYDRLPIDQATPEEAKKATDIAIHTHEMNARGLRDHAKALTTHVLPRLGQPLYDANPVKPAPVKAYVDGATGTVQGAFPTKAARKQALDRLSRNFDLQRAALQNLCLDVPHNERTPAQDEVYWGPSQLNNWRARHSAKVLEVFPQATKIVADIELLVKAREAVKAAPGP